jgi:hypothetical protein
MALTAGAGAENAPVASCTSGGGSVESDPLQTRTEAADTFWRFAMSQTVRALVIGALLCLLVLFLTGSLLGQQVEKVGIDEAIRKAMEEADRERKQAIDPILAKHAQEERGWNWLFVEIHGVPLIWCLVGGNRTGRLRGSLRDTLGGWRGGKWFAPAV